MTIDIERAERWAKEQPLPVDGRPALPCLHDYRHLRTVGDLELFYCRCCAHVQRVRT